MRKLDQLRLWTHLAFFLALTGWAAASPAVPSQTHSNLQVPKVALLFLTRGGMPHEKAWAAWFAAAKWLLPLQIASASSCSPEVSVEDGSQNQNVAFKTGIQHYKEQDLYSIYVHPPTNHTGYRQGSLFAQREIANRVTVQWGDHSMVVAMRLLLRAALQAPLNQRFVFLCELSVPIYPPTVVWQQLMSESKSRLNACPVPKGEEKDPKWSLWRWTPLMLPLVTQDLFRKTSQWVALTRPHALLVDQDSQILDLFDKYCRHPRCVGDEHYFSTLLAYRGVGEETSCAGNAVSSTWGQDQHPLTFQKKAISAELLLSLRHNSPKWREVADCSDQTALRLAPLHFVRTEAEWRFGCGGALVNPPTPYNTSLLERRACTLFARKFHASASLPGTGVGGEFQEETLLQVWKAITGCNPRLAIAPKAACYSPRAGSQRI